MLHAADEGAQTKGPRLVIAPLTQQTGVSPVQMTPPQGTRGGALRHGAMSSPSDVLIPPHATTRAATRKDASAARRILQRTHG